MTEIAGYRAVLPTDGLMTLRNVRDDNGEESITNLIKTFNCMKMSEMIWCLMAVKKMAEDMGKGHENRGSVYKRSY